MSEIDLAEQLRDLRRRVAILERREIPIGLSTLHWHDRLAGGAAFMAYNSATDENVTGNGTTATVDFDTEIFDTGADFTADTFTAPATGQYLLNANVFMVGITAAMTTGYIVLNTSNRLYYGTDIVAGLGASGATSYMFQVTAIADMEVGDTAIVQVKLSNGVGDTADIFGQATNPATYFCGVLLL